MTCITRFNIRSEAPISQFWNIEGRSNLVTMFFMCTQKSSVLHLSDFFVQQMFYFWSVGGSLSLLWNVVGRLNLILVSWTLISKSDNMINLFRKMVLNIIITSLIILYKNHVLKTLKNHVFYS